MQDSLLFHCFLVLVGLAGLIFGADWLVRGSVSAAKMLGVSALLIGLTVVAFGTSAPELFVGVSLNKDGHSGTAVGNIVGSNICNIVLILGLAAMMRPVRIQRQIVFREMPVLLVASLVMMFFLLDWSLSRVEGGILFGGLLTYLAMTAWKAKKGEETEILKLLEEEVPDKVDRTAKQISISVGLILLGIVILSVGAETLKRGALFLAYEWGVPEAIIGLTLIAVGTSLPEIATSVAASLRNHGDLITGNAIGSCIFNVLAVVGLVTLIKPMTGIEGLVWADLWTMFGVLALAIPFMIARWRLGRWEGAALLLIYGIYTFLLVQRGGASASSPL
ncbi:MAG: calcium/sodium antiporter [Verrucomicrobiota bacterium]